MKFGLRKPSPHKSLAARSSPARILRHSFGLKAPRGTGFLISPRRASYNFIYRRTTFPLKGALSCLPGLLILWFIITYWDVIVFIFWTVVVLLLVATLVLVVDWAVDKYALVQNKRALIIRASVRRSSVDYTRWSKAEWETWEKGHRQLIVSGQKRARPPNISLWTEEERLDWEKEEWLRVTREE